MNNCYGVCFNNATIDSFVGNWETFLNGKDTFAIIDNQNKPVTYSKGNMFSYNEKDIRENLKITHDVSKMHFWNSQGNRNIIWFYAHFRMLNFYLSHPGYEYYWFFDDDVHCTNWDKFLSTTKYDSDFLAYFVFKKDGVDTQPLIPFIDSRTYSGQGWFNRFPGDGDKLPNVNEKYLGSFYPVVRYSNKALEALKTLNEQSYHGYSEGFVPTVLNNLGYTLDTLYTPEGTSRHFDTNTIRITHKNQITNWQWL